MIVGATATGKSEVAVVLAGRLGRCEIISADSMQIYRGMDIGTAKPPRLLQNKVPHHLIDIVDPNEDFTVSQFQGIARKTVGEIVDRDHLPILVGGSGLYVRAVIDPLDFPTDLPDSPKRLELEDLARLDQEGLHARLERADPGASARIDLGNDRRVIRAIEAAEGAGVTFLQRRRLWQERRSIYEVFMVGLYIPRTELIQRINSRVERMIEEGLVDEARRLFEKIGAPTRTASQALGYKELRRHLQGEESLEAAVERIKIRTRQYAKRQMTWYKADPRIVWLDVADRSSKETARVIETLVNESQFIIS